MIEHIKILIFRPHYWGDYSGYYVYNIPWETYMCLGEESFKKIGEKYVLRKNS